MEGVALPATPVPRLDQPVEETAPPATHAPLIAQPAEVPHYEPVSSPESPTPRFPESLGAKMELATQGKEEASRKSKYPTPAEEVGPAPPRISPQRRRVTSTMRHSLTLLGGTLRWIYPQWMRVFD